MVYKTSCNGIICMTQMEALYLLCSVITTTVTTILLSFLIPFHLLFLRLLPAGKTTSTSVSLYEGTVQHERRSPVHNSFKYHVRYAFIDLDHTTHPPPDHFSAQQARDIAQTNGHVFLLTIPPSVGYHQNPLSVYYCYDVEGSSKCLKKCIAEATNSPWGERLQFLFNPNSDVVAKLLHVSPFMDMRGNWKMRTSLPGDNLVVTISVDHPELGDYFTASLSAKRVSSSSIQHAVFFWLMPHKISIWMCWQALKLWWKTVEVVPHPKYGNLSYKEDALARDRNLGCCPVFSTQPSNGKQVKQNSQKERWIKWRDAKWPWC